MKGLGGEGGTTSPCLDLQKEKGEGLQIIDNVNVIECSRTIIIRTYKQFYQNLTPCRRFNGILKDKVASTYGCCEMRPF